MKIILSSIASLGILTAGICGISKADHYHSVVENRVVTYVDNCNNLVTVTQPVVVRYYHRHVYNPGSDTWRYSDSKSRGAFGYRPYRGLFRRF